jgi:hypothetical protein
MAKSTRRARGPFAVVSVARNARRTIPNPRPPVAHNGDMYPLDFVYGRLGVALPKVTTIDPDDIPLPYKSLLVHQNDMTTTLEQYVGGRVLLRTLSAFMRGDWYFRRVLLAREDTGHPIEMGAIRMKLDAFPRRIAAQILRNELPLGRILRDGKVLFQSRPRAFLAVTPNSEMMGVFWMSEPRRLYGRRTEILQGGVKIGDIVEVLPILR